jgi:hypothetical protein
MDFGNWESRIRLYHEVRELRDSERHLLFIQGLAEELRIHVTREEGDLLVFRGKCRCFNYEPPARKDLHAHKIYDKLCAIVGRETRAPGTRRNEEYKDG